MKELINIIIYSKFLNYTNLIIITDDTDYI